MLKVRNGAWGLGSELMVKSHRYLGSGENFEKFEYPHDYGWKSKN